MIKFSPQILFIISVIFIFFISSFIWYLILYQAIGFLSGLVILSFFIFIIFWRNFLAFRKAGELIGLKSKKQIFAVSAVLVLCFSEFIWSISFMPFPFFIMGGILTVIFTVIIDICKEYFKKSSIDDLIIRRVLIRDITIGVILITIFIFISPWLPPKVY